MFGRKNLLIFLFFYVLASLFISEMVFAGAADDHTDQNWASSGMSEATDGNDYAMTTYSNDIAAIVNNEIITMEKLMQEVGFFIPRLRAEARTFQEFQKKLRECQVMVLEGLIERILIVEDFKMKGGRVPENHERKAYDRHIYERFNNDRLAFVRYLRDNGKSVREFKNEIKESAIVSFVMHELQAGKTEISSAQIKAYYNEHIDDFTVDRQIFVKKMELMKTKYSEEELQNLLTKIVNAISSGESVGDIIKRFSDFPRHADIGWVSVNELIPEFSHALNGLTAGEHSQAIESNDRIYVLFVTDEKPTKKFALEEVRTTIEQKLHNENYKKIKSDYINKLKKKAYIKVFL